MHHSSVSSEITLLYLLSWNFIWFWQKEPIKVQNFRLSTAPKFRTFDCSGEISPNLFFGRLLSLKAYKISVKNVQKSYVSWHWRVIHSLKKKRIFCFKHDKSLVNYDPSSQKSQKFALWFVPFVQSIWRLT